MDTLAWTSKEFFFKMYATSSQDVYGHDKLLGCQGTLLPSFFRNCYFVFCYNIFKTWMHAHIYFKFLKKFLKT
jgi:hypothetical protein